MKPCPGRRAGLCWGRALGARIKGWLSEALVQEWTETWYIIPTVTWLLKKKQHMFDLRLKMPIANLRMTNLYYVKLRKNVGDSIIDLPVYSHHVTVFVVVWFADFFWREKHKKKELTQFLLIFFLSLSLLWRTDGNSCTYKQKEKHYVVLILWSLTSKTQVQFMPGRTDHLKKRESLWWVQTKK